MKRGSTHNRKEEEEEEEEDDSSGDSDTATTKPTSRALKCLAPHNKSAKTTAGCDSSGHGGRGGRGDRGGGGGAGGGTNVSSRGTRNSCRGMDNTTATTGNDDEVVVIDDNKKRKNTKKTIKKSNKKTTMTKATQQRLRLHYHGTDVDVSSCSLSSYKNTSSDDDDDNGDEDYVDKSKNTKRVGKKTKEGKKKRVEHESMDILKAAEYPLTLRVVFVPRKRATSTTPTAFNSISNVDYAYHQYTSGLTTSSTLEEVYEEIDSVLPTDILGRVDSKSLFYDPACVSVHPINFGVVSKAKSKHVDPITDDNDLLDAISCGGLKLKTTPERAEEPKTIVDGLEAIDEEGEEEEEEGQEGDDEEDEDGGFYYHLDLSVLCIKKNKNVVTGTTRKSNSIEYIRIKLLPLTVSLKGTRNDDESKYEYYPKDKASHDFGTIDIPVKDFCQGTRYCHIRHMMQEEYIKNDGDGDGDICDKISVLSAIFIRTNAGSRNMIKMKSSANLLSMVDTIKSRARPMTADVGDSKAVVIYLSLGWKRTDDPPAGEFDLDNREHDAQLAAGSQQPLFLGSPVMKKSHHQKNKAKRSASQTSSSEGLKIFHWLYSHKDSPYLHKIPLDFRPNIIEEYKDDSNERSKYMSLIDEEIEDLDVTDFPSIGFLEQVEKLKVFFPLNKEYPPTNGGLPQSLLSKSGQGGTKPKDKFDKLTDNVSSLVEIMTTAFGTPTTTSTGPGDSEDNRVAEFILITRDNTSYSLPVASIKPNRNNEQNAAAAVSPAPQTANLITGLDVLKKFAAETKAKKIGLFPKPSTGDIYIYTFDGSEFRSDQFQQLSLKTIIKVTGKERTKKIVMTIVQEQTVPDEDDYDVAF